MPNVTIKIGMGKEWGRIVEANVRVSSAFDQPYNRHLPLVTLIRQLDKIIQDYSDKCNLSTDTHTHQSKADSSMRILATEQI